MSTRASGMHRRRQTNKAIMAVLEGLESRYLLSAAFDITGITALRNDAAYSAVDGSGIGVAILDTGTYANHPDLQGNFVAWFDAVTNGRNARTSTGDLNINHAIDPEGHGSHVAGTAVSSNPEIGVATHANLIGVRVLPGDGEAWPSYDPVLAGLQWVAANYERYNIKVVNMSLGVPSTNYNYVPSATDEATAIQQLEDLGITVVCASGNSFGGFVTPGAEIPGVFATLQVGNTWEDSGTADDRSFIGLDTSTGRAYGVGDDNPQVDQFTASSQRSTLPNQVAAPGTAIFSTWNGANGQMYNTIRGTSMASPLVAGMVALMQDAAFTYGGRYLSTDEVRQIVRQTADNIVDLQTASTWRAPLVQNAAGRWVISGPTQDIPETGLTFKRVNVYSAIQEVRDLVTTGGNPQDPPPTDPTQRTDDTNNTRDAAIEVPAMDGTEDFVFDGAIGHDGQVQIGPDDVDLFKLVLDAPGLLSLRLAAPDGGTSFDGYVRLFNPDGTVIDYDDDNGPGSYPSLEDVRLPAGTFYFGISSYNNIAYSIVDGANATDGHSEGDYEVTISLTNPDPDGIVQGANPVNLTDPDTSEPDTDVLSNYITGVIGTDVDPLGSAAPINVGATDVDIYQVVATDSGNLVLDTRAVRQYGSAGVDSILVVFDENLAEVGYNDDIVIGSNTDSHLVVPVDEGHTYYVAVTTYGNRHFNVSDPFDRQSTTNDTGQYDLYLSFTNGDQNGTAYTAINFNTRAVNDQLGGRIGADFGIDLLSVPENDGYKDVDFFSYIAPADGTLELNATSDDMQASLAIWQINSTQDDVVKVDQATGQDARLTMRVAADDVLFISVTGMGNEGFNWFAPASGSGGQVGTYTLSANLASTADFFFMTDDSVNLNVPEDIAVGGWADGEISRDGSAVVGADDIDVYRLEPTTTQTLHIYTIAADENSADTFVRVFNSAGVELAFNDNASSSTTQSSLSLNVTAGQTYYIGVNGAGANARNYDVLTGAGAGDGSTGPYRLIVAAQGSEPTVTIAIANASVTEGDDGTTNATFTVSLSEAAATDVTIHYATGNGTAAIADDDYAATSGTLTIPAGQISGVIHVSVMGDTKVEADETFNVTLSNPTGATLATSIATGTIANDDVPRISIQPASLSEGKSGGHNMSFNVSLSQAGLVPVTVHFATSDGTATVANNDYTVASGTLTIPAGQTTAVIDVPIIGDAKVESDETFTLTLSSPANADFSPGSPTLAVTGTIVNDDPQFQVYYMPAGGAAQEIQDNQSSAISFGSVLVKATAPVRTFRIVNRGTKTLTFSSMVIPAGFSVVSGLSRSLAPGKYGNFTVRMSTTTAATRSGVIRVYNNIVGKSPFRIAVSGIVRARTRQRPAMAAAQPAATPLLMPPAVMGNFFAASRPIELGDPADAREVYGC